MVGKIVLHVSITTVLKGLDRPSLKEAWNRCDPDKQNLVKYAKNKVLQMIIIVKAAGTHGSFLVHNYKGNLKIIKINNYKS